MSLVTLQEATRRLRISRATLYRWAREGRLTLYRLGPRATRIREEDLQRLETEAAPVHPTASNEAARKDHGLWEEARVEDLGRALEEVECEIPPEELRAYLRDVKQIGTPVHWNADRQTFDRVAR